MPSPRRYASTSSRSSTPPPTPQKVRIGRLKISRSWLIALGVMAVLGLAALITARPAWHAFRRIQGERFARQAERFIQDQQWTLAFERTRSALQLNPSNPRALRTAATLFTRIGVDSALSYFDALLTSPAGTPSDREDYVAAALQLGNTNVAAVQLRVLLDARQPTPRTHRLAAQMSALNGNVGEAIRLARIAAQSDPGNPTNIFTLASFLSSGSRVTDHEEAIRALWPFAETNGPFQLRALQVILHAPRSSRNDRERVEAILSAKSPRTFDEEVQLFEARANLDPSATRFLADELIRTHQPKSPRELRLIVEWLIVHDLTREALNLLTGERSFQDRTLFLLHHRALLSVGETQKGYNFLFHAAAPFPPFELEAYRCQAAAALGDAKLRDQHLTQAANLAESELRRAALVTQLAVLCGNPAPAVTVWRRILRNPRHTGTALRQLAILADLQGDLSGARDLARQLATEEPGNPAPRLAIAHADLLLGENVPAALAEARRQLDADPDSPEVRGLVALGHLRLGQPKEALDVLRGTIIRFETAPGGLLAIMAATFAANDLLPEAQKYLDRTPIAGLKAEERELLRPLIALESRLVTGQPPR